MVRLMKLLGVILFASATLAQIEIEIADGRLEHVPDVVSEDNTDLFDPDDLIPMKRDFDKFEHVPEVVDANNTDLFDPEDLVPMSHLERATSQCGCGFSNANPAAGRIVNGQPVENHARPYQAYLQLCFGNSCYMCGGTLINKRYVITAMHCIVDGNGNLPSNTVVGLGLYRRSDDGQNVQRLGVEKYIQRSDYGRLNNDIAILRLNADVQFNDHVQPACLPTDASLTYANQDAVVSGWGTTSSGGSTSSILMEVTVEITPQDDSTCRAYGNLPMTQMCAYTEGKDSCQGDSGGPMVVTEDGRNTLVGVVSYGRGCATPGYAGVYARVTTYLDWINANVADGWCGDEPAPTTTSAPTTTAPTTPPSGGGPVCDLTCTNIGDLTGNYYLNGILSTCNSGMCYAQDGSDLCAALGFDGCNSEPTTEAPTTTTTKRPKKQWCKLRCLIGKKTGWFYLNGVYSYCKKGKCYAYWGGDLCSMLFSVMEAEAPPA